MRNDAGGKGADSLAADGALIPSPAHPVAPGDAAALLFAVTCLNVAACALHSRYLLTAVLSRCRDHGEHESCSFELLFLLPCPICIHSLMAGIRWQYLYSLCYNNLLNCIRDHFNSAICVIYC